MSIFLASQQGGLDWGRCATFLLKKPEQFELQFDEQFVVTGAALCITPKTFSETKLLLGCKWYDVVCRVEATENTQRVEELRGGIANSARHLFYKYMDTYQTSDGAVVFPLPVSFICANGWKFSSDYVQALSIELVDNQICVLESVKMRIDMQVQKQKKNLFHSAIAAQTVNCRCNFENVVSKITSTAFENNQLQYVYFVPIHVVGCGQEAYYTKDFNCVFEIHASDGAATGDGMLKDFCVWKKVLNGDAVAAKKMCDMGARVFVPRETQKENLCRGRYKTVSIMISCLTESVALEVQPIFVFEALDNKFTANKEPLTLEERVAKIEKALLH